MFDDEDVDKANWLHEHGLMVELSITELAKRLYDKRQHDKNTDVESFLSSDRE